MSAQLYSFPTPQRRKEVYRGRYRYAFTYKGGRSVLGLWSDPERMVFFCRGDDFETAIKTFWKANPGIVPLSWTREIAGTWR